MAYCCDLTNSCLLDDDVYYQLCGASLPDWTTQLDLVTTTMQIFTILMVGSGSLVTSGVSSTTVVSEVSHNVTVAKYNLMETIAYQSTTVMVEAARVTDHSVKFVPTVTLGAGTY